MQHVALFQGTARGELDGGPQDLFHYQQAGVRELVSSLEQGMVSHGAYVQPLAHRSPNLEGGIIKNPNGLFSERCL